MVLNVPPHRIANEALTGSYMVSKPVPCRCSFKIYLHLN